MRLFLLRAILLITVGFTAHAVPPNYKPATLDPNGTVIFHPVENISLLFQVSGSALVNPLVQARNVNHKDGIYMDFDQAGNIPPRLYVHNQLEVPVTIQGQIFYVGNPRPVRFTVQCKVGEYAIERWHRPVAEVRLTKFSVTPKP